MLIDMAGQRVGQLLVLNRDGTLNTEAAWLCLCDCGKTTRVRGGHLRDAHVQSCGCLQRTSQLTHGHAATRRRKASPTYKSWHSMHARCSYPKNNRYKDYGGRGVTVCERWLKFENFLADMGERPPGKTLDRINGRLGYGPENCRWATPSEQRRNQARYRPRSIHRA